MSVLQKWRLSDRVTFPGYSSICQKILSKINFHVNGMPSKVQEIQISKPYIFSVDKHISIFFFKFWVPCNKLFQKPS